MDAIIRRDIINTPERELSEFTQEELHWDQLLRTPDAEMRMQSLPAEVASRVSRTSALEHNQLKKLGNQVLYKKDVGLFFPARPAFEHDGMEYAQGRAWPWKTEKL